MTAAELLTLRGTSPLRRARWRWDLAKYLGDNTAARDAFPADRYVTDALTVQTAFRETADQQALFQALAELGEAVDAYQFWTAGEACAPGGPAGPPDPTDHLGPLSPAALARAQLEALILADKTPAAIAKVTGLSVAAVEYYERWFLDVRDRLKNPGWVATNVIGPLLSPSPYVTLPNLVRAYGYYTGSSRVVRTVVSGFDKGLARKAAADPGRFFAADAAATGALKAALAVRLMNITDGRTFGRIVELHHEAVDIEAKTAGALGSASEEKYKEAVASLFGRMRRGHREVPDDGATPKLIAPAEAG